MRSTVRVNQCEDGSERVDDRGKWPLGGSAQDRTKGLASGGDRGPPETTASSLGVDGGLAAN